MLFGLVFALPRSSRGQEQSAIVVIAHPDAPVAAVDGAALEAIFTTRMRHWGGGQRIVPFNLPPGSRHRRGFDQATLGLGSEQVARFWIDRRIRGGGRPPRQLSSPALMVRVVGALPGAIGYVPESTPIGNLKVLARIVDGEVTTP